jgi:phosphoenolpyruvate phosphomutase
MADGRIWCASKSSRARSRQHAARAAFLEFLARWNGSVPVVLVPTSYPDLTVARMQETGKVALAIWGNHAIRASVKAMQTTFARILAEGGILSSESHIASVAEIFRLQNMEDVKAQENRFLR